MHFYWRIHHELSAMGEGLVFCHPSYIRAFGKWVRKNASGLAAAHDLTFHNVLAAGFSLN